MNNPVFMALRQAAERTVVDDGRRQLSGAGLEAAARRLAACLNRHSCHRIALFADNGISWIVADLASQLSNCVIIPIPLFFSQTQFAHVLRSSDVDTLLTDQAVALDICGSDALLTPVALDDDKQGGESGYAGLTLLRRHPTGTAQIPPRTHKITFTSGTTGAPRGVCLALEHELRVADSLAMATALEQPRHLCVLPLSTLLENLAGVYAPILAGGTVIVPALEELGLHGSSGLDPRKLLRHISAVKPQTLILVPELLDALISGVKHGWQAPGSLRFIAVGGGKVAVSVVKVARALGLPVYEGYGLSECGSVVALNVPGADRPGSVGQPLPHTSVGIDSGEIVVSGAQYLGYINEPQSWTNSPVYTGDLGYRDGEGFVHVQGRRKNLLISSFGRNISPEWVESELLASPLLRQVVVIGDARPYCTALLLAGNSAVTDQEIEQWLETVNSALPDYAQIRKWTRLDAPLSTANGMLTANGRARRDAIHAHYANAIQKLYLPLSEECTA